MAHVPVVYCNMAHVPVVYCNIVHVPVVYCTRAHGPVVYCNMAHGLVVYCTTAHGPVVYCTTAHGPVVYCTTAHVPVFIVLTLALVPFQDRMLWVRSSLCLARTGHKRAWSTCLGAWPTTATSLCTSRPAPLDMHHTRAATSSGSDKEMSPYPAVRCFLLHSLYSGPSPSERVHH